MPGVGRFGFGIVGGVGVESQIFQNRVIEGMLVGVPTTPSSQVTGAGAYDFNADIATGLLAVDGTVKEYAVQADYDVGSGAAAILIVGQSVVYSIIAYKSKGDGVVYMKSVQGVVATTGLQVAPTDAAIEANLADGTFWYRLANVTVNRTGDTTVTQSQDNTVRPTLIITRA